MCAVISTDLPGIPLHNNTLRRRCKNNRRAYNVIPYIKPTDKEVVEKIEALLKEKP